MLSNLVDKILSLGKMETMEIGKRTYSKDKLTVIKPSEFTSPTPLDFKTLAGMRDFIIAELPEEKLIIAVESFEKVSLYGQIQPKNDNKRFCYATSQLLTMGYGFGDWYILEDFIVALLSQFKTSEKTTDLLSYVSKMADEHVVESTDGGFSQTIQIKTGLTTKSQVTITNPIKLKPYRTFREVDQPESNCIFRTQKSTAGPKCVLFTSDGDAWKLEAVKNIKDWFKKETSVSTSFNVSIIG